MSTAAWAIATPETIYDRLMETRQGNPVEETLARILTSWLVGYGAMPDWLGLGKSGFQQLMQRHFPGFGRAAIINPGFALDQKRKDEMADLRKLLMENRTTHSISESWMADIVVAGCLGNEHLWQDLGLWNRADLSKLMLDNFEPLARLNDRDMKWKKFLYKQLCETEGIYTCRSPSCEACDDYQNCFGPEE